MSPTAAMVIRLASGLGAGFGGGSGALSTTGGGSLGCSGSSGGGEAQPAMVKMATDNVLREKLITEPDAQYVNLRLPELIADKV